MLYQTLYSIALTLMAMTFLLSATNTVRHWQNTLGMMKAKGLPQAAMLLALATLLKFTASIMLILHFHANLAAAGLLIFTVIATLLFDNFWSATGMQRQMMYFGFLSNLSIIGGLLLVVSI
jgi:putative oxidoreductase